MDVDPKTEEAGQQTGAAPAGPAPQPVPGQMPPPAAPQAAPAPKAEPGASVAVGAPQNEAAAAQINGALPGPAGPAVPPAQAGPQLASHASGVPFQNAACTTGCLGTIYSAVWPARIGACVHSQSSCVPSECCYVCLASGLGEMGPPPPVPQGLPKTQSGAIQLPTLLSIQSGISNAGGGNSGIQLPSWPQVFLALA
jgi:hypothetical protein